ncbi:MAG TPA: MoaD/ThiS family protein [Candidatus Sulfotelmatobacter sp.]|nr:MoaD/ThiS family protein [Candidatus Sulfotelmatobacter sp.]
MPTVTLKLSGWLQQALGGTPAQARGIPVAIPEGASIPDMARQLAAQHAGFRRLLFDEEQEFGANVLVVLNGCFVNPHDRSETLLKDGDEIMLLPVMDGG